MDSTVFKYTVLSMFSCNAATREKAVLQQAGVCKHSLNFYIIFY